MKALIMRETASGEILSHTVSFRSALCISKLCSLRAQFRLLYFFIDFWWCLLRQASGLVYSGLRIGINP